MAKRIFFARYQEEIKLGKGGIGEVFRVRDLWEKKTIALKFLQPEFRSTPLQEAFRQEFFLLKRLPHPYLVSVFDYQAGNDSLSPASTLDLVEGGFLFD